LFAFFVDVLIWHCSFLKLFIFIFNRAKDRERGNSNNHARDRQCWIIHSFLFAIFVDVSVWLCLLLLAKWLIFGNI